MLELWIDVPHGTWIRVDKGYADKTSGRLFGGRTYWLMFLGCLKPSSFFFWTARGNQRIWHWHPKEEVHGFGDSERRAAGTDEKSNKRTCVYNETHVSLQLAQALWIHNERERVCGFSNRRYMLSSSGNHPPSLLDRIARVFPEIISRKEKEGRKGEIDLHPRFMR